jgi:hypothetical protein
LFDLVVELTSAFIKSSPVDRTLLKNLRKSAQSADKLLTP